MSMYTCFIKFEQIKVSRFDKEDRRFNHIF